MAAGMSDTELYPFIVIEITATGFDGLGERKFRVPPRVGEGITLDRNGKAVALIVRQVLHPIEPTVAAGT